MEQATHHSLVFETCLWLTVLLPLVSSLFSYITAERYSWLPSFTSPLIMLGSTICAAQVFFNQFNADTYRYSLSWFAIGGSDFRVGLLLNNTSVLMLFLVTFISFVIHVYSTGYMAGDMRMRRYFGMLGFFTFAMLGIVLADNLLLIFVFWELVGFASYMLIGHFEEQPEAVAAAKKAFVFNRIGDAGFLVALMIVWVAAGTFSIETLSMMHDFRWQTAAALCLFCGVIGKSAQFPLMSWLPDAMRGPTPVSALLHAATMVAAGVFLLARFHFLFTPSSLNVVACIGVSTALLGALSALAQTDIKKILAYSTISQLGLMITAVGAGAPDAALLHLFTHAFFKACLFLCAGSIIYSLAQAQYQTAYTFDVQDIRNMGGLRNKLRFTYFTMLISACSLAGIPFLSGFLSKDAIITAVYQWQDTGLTWRNLIFVGVMLTGFITVLYTFRMMWAIFHSPEKMTEGVELIEAPAIMRAPMALLAAGSLWWTVSWNPLDFRGWLWRSNELHSASITTVSVIWVILALAAAYFLFRAVHTRWPVFTNGFYLDKVYNASIAVAVAQASRATAWFDVKAIDKVLHFVAYIQVTTAHLTGWFDRVIIDGSVDAAGGLARVVGAVTRSTQRGKIQLYIFWAIFGIIIFLIWIVV